MGSWEELLLDGYPTKPLVYFRFCDDIFGCWQGGEDSLKRFHDYANSIHPKIQVDLRMSTSSIEFLDVLVKIDEAGHFSTDLFTKPTDSKAYLHYQSDHSTHVYKKDDTSWARGKNKENMFKERGLQTPSKRSKIKTDGEGIS